MLLTIIKISILLFSAGILLVPIKHQTSVRQVACGFGGDPDQAATPTPTPKRPRPKPTPTPPGGFSPNPGGHAGTPLPGILELKGVHAFLGERGPGCDPTIQQQLDISGNYEGILKYPAGDLSGNFKLAIEGNEFVLSQGDKKLSGQVAAVRTCDYSAVAMRFNETSVTPAMGSGLPITISLRAEREGKRLWLASIPGEPNQLTFEPRGRSIWSVLKIWKWIR